MPDDDGGLANGRQRSACVRNIIGENIALCVIGMPMTAEVERVDQILVQQLLCDFKPGVAAHADTMKNQNCGLLQSPIDRCSEANILVLYGDVGHNSPPNKRPLWKSSYAQPCQGIVAQRAEPGYVATPSRRVRFATEDARCHAAIDLKGQ